MIPDIKARRPPIRFRTERMSIIQHRVDFKSIPWTSPAKGVREKVYRVGDRQLRLVEYSKTMQPHLCEKGHFGYVLDGKMEIQFAKEAQAYSAGDGVFIPAGEEHKHTARMLTDTVTIIFVEDA
jgi:mannose-6-phosphate isomerase-like protein (cupin superfamily)